MLFTRGQAKPAQPADRVLAAAERSEPAEANCNHIEACAAGDRY